ncbi:MAG: ATPase domain-containing protein [Candidatus Bathyarchaeia archaeon]
MLTGLTPTGLDGIDKVLGGFPKGGLIVLAGQPGTGKTILSAKILYEGGVRYSEPGVYASFTEDKHRFYSNMRGLGLDFEELENRGLFAYLDLIPVGRLGVSSIAEFIIDTVDKLKARRLVIDSFSALAQNFRDEAELRIFTHNVLYRICRNMDCTTILIEEIPIGAERIGFGVEEFIADATVILRKRLFDERILRELEIVKLRSVELKEYRFIFTLSSGVRVYPPFKLPTYDKHRLAYPPNDPSGNMYSTGVRDLDRILGGYPRGSTIVMEVDPKVEDNVYRLGLLLPVVYSFIEKHRPILIIPSLNISFEEILSYNRYIGYRDEVIEELLRVVGLGLRGEEHRCLINLEGRDIDEDYGILVNRLDQFMKGRGPPLAIIGLDSLIARYGLEDSIRMVSLSIHETMKVGGLCIIIAKPVYRYRRVVEVLPAISTMHLKLSREHGVYLLYGVKPRTGLYVMDIDVSDNLIETRLTPMR